MAAGGTRPPHVLPRPVPSPAPPQPRGQMPTQPCRPGQGERVTSPPATQLLTGPGRSPGALGEAKVGMTEPGEGREQGDVVVGLCHNALGISVAEGTFSACPSLTPPAGRRPYHFLLLLQKRGHAAFAIHPLPIF